MPGAVKHEAAENTEHESVTELRVAVKYAAGPRWHTYRQYFY